MWKKRPAPKPKKAAREELAGSPEQSCGNYEGKSMAAGGAMDAIMWRHERLLSMTVVAHYEKKKGVNIGSLTLSGDRETQEMQIRGLIEILEGLLE